MNNSINNIILGSCLLSGFGTTLPQLQAALPEFEKEYGIRWMHPRTPTTSNPTHASTDRKYPYVIDLKTQKFIASFKHPRERMIENREVQARPFELIALGYVPGSIESLLVSPDDLAAENTALHMAVMQNRLKRVSALLDKGVPQLGMEHFDSNVKNINNETPLHKATEDWVIGGRGSAAIVRALLDAGADPNTPDNNDLTPLQKAHNICIRIMHDDEETLKKISECASKRGIKMDESIAEIKAVYALLQHYEPQIPEQN
jgi:hypothetical protein